MKSSFSTPHSMRTSAPNKIKPRQSLPTRFAKGVIKVLKNTAEILATISAGVILGTIALGGCAVKAVGKALTFVGDAATFPFGLLVAALEDKSDKIKEKAKNPK